MRVLKKTPRFRSTITRLFRPLFRRSSNSTAYPMGLMNDESTPAVDLPTFFNPATCVRKGLLPIRRGSSLSVTHSIYYEQHGTGPKKVVCIMGMAASSFGWYSQVEHFGGRLGDEYSVLAFDNRGVGHSGTPRGPYTTSAMAEDAIDLLDYLGWTSPRELNIVAHSLGGMISQELAYWIPDRVASLVLCASSARGGLPPMASLIALAKILRVKEPAKRIPIFAKILYSEKYLYTPIPNDLKGRLWIDLQTESYFAREATVPSQTLMGAISQMSAGLTHYVSPSRLSYIASHVPKIVILSGDVDQLVNPENSGYLVKHMPGAERLVWKGNRHSVNTQDPERFNALIERAIGEGLSGGMMEKKTQ